MGFAINSFAQLTAGSLPVVLVRFSADLTINKKVAVSWTTQQQINTDCFDVEKSNDGISWRCIATVKASGNAATPVAYTVLDLFPLRGSNFYRLRIKDLNNSFGYTITQKVHLNVLNRSIIYPNPSSNIVNISLGEVPRANWNLILINSGGQTIIQKKYNRYTTIVTLPVNNYPNGNYTLEITDGNSRQSNKLMINHN